MLVCAAMYSREGVTAGSTPHSKCWLNHIVMTDDIKDHSKTEEVLQRYQKLTKNFKIYSFCKESYF